MAKKRLPLFHKVSNVLRISVLIHKLRKPIIPKLLLFKKLTKHKLLIKNYNYGFSTIGGYQFSPSSTPLIHCHGNRFKNKGHKDKDLCSFFYLYWCLGNFKVEGSDNGGGIRECQLEALQMAVIENEDFSVTDSLFDSGVEESVDEKAEKFIQKFYQEMRMQRQESM
jgi:hypothetical protein